MMDYCENLDKLKDTKFQVKMQKTPMYYYYLLCLEFSFKALKKAGHLGRQTNGNCSNDSLFFLKDRFKYLYEKKT